MRHTAPMDTIFEWAKAEFNAIAGEIGIETTQVEELTACLALCRQQPDKFKNLQLKEKRIFGASFITELLFGVTNYFEDGTKKEKPSIEVILVANITSWPAWTAICKSICISDVGEIKKVAKLGNKIQNHNYYKSRYPKISQRHYFPEPLARLERNDQSKLIMEQNFMIADLKHKIQELENEIARLNHRTTTDILRETLNKPKSRSIEILTRLLVQALDNEGKTNGRSYDDVLKPLFVMFASFGEKVSLACHDFFDFPVESTIRGYREDIEHELFKDSESFDDDIFSGSREAVHALIHDFYIENPDENEKKAVLVVDAAAIRPNIRVKSCGDVIGLVNEEELDEETARELIDNPDAFMEFCYSKADSIARAIFVVLLVPIAPDLNAFPICEIPATSGTATADIVAKLNELKVYAEEKGIEIIGKGNDGDKQYMPSAYLFIRMCIDKLFLELEKPLHLKFTDKEFETVFYDTYHNGKNNRYYFSANVTRYFWSNRKAKTFTRDDFLQCGIDKNALSSSPNIKMYDSLAVALFNKENVIRCILNERSDLALMLLPTTLLFISVFDTEITREDRIRYLSLGFAIIALYSFESDAHSKERPSYRQRETNDSQKISPSKAFPSIWCAKYLEVVHGLIQQLCANTPLSIGSLGSHKIEHWFGLVRRLTKGDYSMDMFTAITRKTIVYQAACKKMNYTQNIKKRCSDSGAILREANEPLSNKPFGYDLCTAYHIIKNCGIELMLKDELVAEIERYNEDIKFTTIAELFPIIEPKLKAEITTRQYYWGKMSGATQDANHKVLSQYSKKGMAVAKQPASKAMFRKMLYGQYFQKK